MERQTLNISPRTETGSRAARRLRREGMIPATLYGSGAEPMSISINLRELRKALSGVFAHSTMLELKGEKVDGKLALVSDVQHDPVNDFPVHADLQELRLDKPVHVTVPLHFVGKSKGVAEGGLVSIQLRELSIEALPNNIPSSIDVKIEELGIGDSLHVNELVLPEGVKALGDLKIAVVSVVGRMAEEEAKPVEEVAAVPGAAPAAAPAAETKKA